MYKSVLILIPNSPYSFKTFNTNIVKKYAETVFGISRQGRLDLPVRQKSGGWHFGNRQIYVSSFVYILKNCCWPQFVCYDDHICSMSSMLFVRHFDYSCWRHCSAAVDPTRGSLQKNVKVKFSHVRFCTHGATYYAVIICERIK